jgi:hypothetical protein
MNAGFAERFALRYGLKSGLNIENMLKLFPSIPRKIEAKSNRIFPET